MKITTIIIIAALSLAPLGITGIAHASRLPGIPMVPATNDPSYAYESGVKQGKAFADYDISHGQNFALPRQSYIAQVCSNSAIDCAFVKGYNSAYRNEVGPYLTTTSTSSLGTTYSSITGADRINENWASQNKANDDMLNQKQQQFIDNRQNSPSTGYCNTNSC